MRPHYILLYCALMLLAHNATAQARPVEFIENKGQWPDWFRYRATTEGGDILFEPDGFRFVLGDPSNVHKIDSFQHGLLRTAPLTRFHVYKMKLEGAMTPEISGSKRQDNYYNYFLGNDAAKWKSDIHPYLALDYKHIYQGVDMHITSSSGSPEYEFIVAPGADAGQVRLRFDGPDKMQLSNGDLVIQTSVGKVLELKPYAYQYIDDNKVEVPCRYKLRDNVVTYELPKDYDHSRTLVIDPIVLWASFTGSTADNWGFTATYDNAGAFYMGGIVNCIAFGGTFPVSPGAYQMTFGGGTGVSGFEWASDMGLMKLTSDGTARVYATFLGGALNERPHSIIVDNGGNLIVAGRTHSTNYPVTSGAYQASNAGGWDIVVTKLNPTATALVASTYIGGTGEDGINFDSTEFGYGHLKYNYGDDARSEVQIDNQGNIYVAGSTSSANFPTTPTAIATTLAGLQDGVVFKMNSTLSTLLWSTYLKGSGDDAGYVLAFNPSQSSVYVAGGTGSTDFPSTPGTWHATYQGDSADGYILKFRNSPPYNLQRGTFVGTGNFDQVFGIQVDDDGNVYAMGQSLGGAFPVTAGVWSHPNSCQFIIKLDSNLSNNLISTVYGSGDPTHVNVSPVAFLVDTCGNVYVSGWGGDIMQGLAPVLTTHTGTTTGMDTTPGCYQSTTDGYDFYFLVLGPGMTTVRYATFYGRNAPGSTGEHVDGGTSRFNKQGIIYQGICANCGGTGGSAPPFPTTAGVWAPVSGSTANCNEAGLKIAFNIGPVDCNITAGPSTTGCAPLTVNFYNTTTNGLSFVWDFGDGSPTTTSFTATHTFTAAGTYTVTLSAANSNACFRTDDTARLVVVVDTHYIKPAFTARVTDSCGPYAASFTNTSVTNITTGAPTYQWYFGDGTSFSGQDPTSHTYPDTGCYDVILVMSHPDACKSPDTARQRVCIRGYRVSLNFTIPDSLCAGLPFIPGGGGVNATTITWAYGDGRSGTGTPPAQTYSAGGTYTVTFVATNPGACNLSDSVKRVIKILPAPTADFSYSPTIPEANVPTKYTNLSRNAVRYLWDFGDGNTSGDVNPTHQFNKTGNWKTCLTAYNTSACPAVVCKTVPSDVQPIIGLPTGFSPNGDGQNDILYVRGAAIQTLDLKIYNRWGQLVFQTTSQAIGWDGTFNGQPQPMEAYAYVLHVTFIDESTKLMKGNITLLR